MRFIKKFENFFLSPDVEEDEEDYVRNKRSSIMNPGMDDEDTELDSMPMSRNNMPMSRNNMPMSRNNMPMDDMPEDEMPMSRNNMPMSRNNMPMDEMPEEEYDEEEYDEEEYEGEGEYEEEDNFHNNHIMRFEAKNSSYKKSGLKKPEKADLNKDKKISGYEKKRGKAIEDSIDKKGGKGLTAAQKKLPAGLQKAILAKKK
jgi:hypothetical protein